MVHYWLTQDTSPCVESVKKTVNQVGLFNSALPNSKLEQRYGGPSIIQLDLLAEKINGDSDLLPCHTLGLVRIVFILASVEHSRRILSCLSYKWDLSILPVIVARNYTSKHSFTFSYNKRKYTHVQMYT